MVIAIVHIRELHTHATNTALAIMYINSRYIGESAISMAQRRRNNDRKKSPIAEFE